MMMLDFSIVTVSYNSALTISETIDSVLSQKGVDFEYIIIDGGSKDNTLEIIKSYNDPRVKYISEPDDGLYNAMNKGLKLASGEVVAILNSDDLYTHELVLDRVKNEFLFNSSDIVSGHIYYFDEDKNIKGRVYKCSDYLCSSQWLDGWQPPHPSTFVKKVVYDNVGEYSECYKISSDYDFLFRALYLNKFKHSVIDEYLVAMRTGGESTRSFGAIIKGNKEVREILKSHGVHISKLFTAKKITKKLFNKFSRK
ncbi:glycosyltransferase family 2 protein [Photobacterium sp. GB-50]|uniref:glycosyltransferase family 2 protein n=1 Tax=Photobacterium sp. GB-50 TaxID=2022107 RepID=UPI0011B23C22|nr:glycosyltransferase family 2 protein [Photobacterium sp. GB-50]